VISNGLTGDLASRFHQHNSGQNKSTKPYAPFVLVHSEEYRDSLLARAREKQLKTTAGKRWLKKTFGG
jgi:predicted GIY-YIG superfamily endonuclease